MSYIRRLFFFTLVVCVATAQGQTKNNEPHIGYLYPSGGQQGTVIRITAGGRFLEVSLTYIFPVKACMVLLSNISGLSLIHI